MKKDRYQRLQEKYGGMYVASKKVGGRVAASGKTAAQLFKDMKKKGIYDKPHAFAYIPPKDVITLY